MISDRVNWPYILEVLYNFCDSTPFTYFISPFPELGLFFVFPSGNVLD